MAFMWRQKREPHQYTLEEAVSFLEYDRASLEYWLQTGQLQGIWDRRLGTWLISAGELISFLRQSDEPWPTGVAHQAEKPTWAGRSGFADAVTS
jgi:hypothetical protein